MELLNEKVCHKAFKNGTIIDFTDSYITVKFDVTGGTSRSARDRRKFCVKAE